MALLALLVLVPPAFAQDAPPVTPPDMIGIVEPLTPVELAAFINLTPAAPRTEEPFGLPSSEPVQEVDVAERLAHASTATRNTFFVDPLTFSTDTTDANVGDGLCADAAGRCSLRAAIQQSNLTLSTDTIIIPPGVVTLDLSTFGDNIAASGDLDITDSVIIQGAGAGRTFIFGGGAALANDRIFHVFDGSTITKIDLIDLSIYGGKTDESGGGVFGGCYADILLQRVNLFDNFGANGGGVSISGSGCLLGTFPRLTVYETAVFRNTSNGNQTGAGIDVFSGGTLTMINSTVSLNVNQNTSGAISAGIFMSSTTSNVARIRNSTIIDNSQPNSLGTGAGLYIGTGSNVTLSDNLIAFNTFDGDTGNCFNNSASAVSLGGNVYSTGTSNCPTITGDVTGQGITLVSGIAYNAPGQTPTGQMFGSSAATISGVTCGLSQDQRGVARPPRGCSSGAYQYAPTLLNDLPKAFSLLSPVNQTNQLVRTLTWQFSGLDITRYDVIVRNALGTELFRIPNLTPDTDTVDALGCFVQTLGGSVSGSQCTLTLPRSLFNRFLLLETYEWEVRAYNSVGMTASNARFIVGVTQSPLLLNTDFELDTNADGEPDSWRRLRGDGAVCNDGQAFSGLCYYRMTGAVGRNSLLRQTITTSFPRDTQLLLSGFMRGTGAINGMSMTVTLTYADGTTQVKTINFRRTSGYQPLSFFDPNLRLRVQRSGMTSISVVFTNRSASGVLRIDRLGVSVLTP
jgi:hypothetical protein